MIDLKSNLSSLQRLYQNRVRKLQSANLAAEKESAAALKVRLMQKSSGPFSTAWLSQQARLRKAGLYSVRSPAPPDDPVILNLQSGSIKHGWQVEVRPVGGSGSTTSVTNTSPHWKYMAGTAKMIPRETVQAAQREERFPRLKRLALAKLEVLKP